MVTSRPDDLGEHLPADLGGIRHGHPPALVVEFPEPVIGFGRVDFSVLEHRFDRFAVDLVRVRGSDFIFCELLCLIQHHVAHIRVMIGVAPLAQNGFSDLKNLVQLELDVSFINPQTRHTNLLIPIVIKSRKRLRPFPASG
jgi:hypothetical protein